MPASTEFHIRPIRPGDDVTMAKIIRQVMPEFSADGPGFALHDSEVDTLSEAYTRRGSAYFVIEQNGRVMGGGGIAPLLGATPDTCELRKMYFLPEARGFGVGQQLVELCVETARTMGYKWCYLETLKTMIDAKSLYERNGFRRIDKPLGRTGHFGCDSWYVKGL